MTTYTLYAQEHIEDKLREDLFPWLAWVPEYTEDKGSEDPFPTRENLFPNKIIQSGNVTTIIWNDGTKTHVTKMDGDEYNEYDAIVHAYFKRQVGNTTKRRAKWIKAAKKKVFKNKHK